MGPGPELPSGPSTRGARQVPSFSPTLEKCIHAALALANAKRHELATLEHLLLALIDEPDASRVMRACSVDLGELRKNLEEQKDKEDLLMLLAMDRIKGEGEFMGLLKGFGLRRGAYGTTMSWDTVDMFVTGVDIKSMETVVKRLKEIKGGGVFAIGDEVVAEIVTPLCGFYSIKSMEELNREVKRVEEKLKENGVNWEKPVLTIDTLGTPAIPHIRITHRGYVRLKDRELLSLEV